MAERTVWDIIIFRPLWSIMIYRPVWVVMTYKPVSAIMIYRPVRAFMIYRPVWVIVSLIPKSRTSDSDVSDVGKDLLRQPAPSMWLILLPKVDSPIHC